MNTWRIEAPTPNPYSPKQYSTALKPYSPHPYSPSSPLMALGNSYSNRYSPIPSPPPHGPRKSDPQRWGSSGARFNIIFDTLRGRRGRHKGCPGRGCLWRRLIGSGCARCRSWRRRSGNRTGPNAAIRCNDWARCCTIVGASSSCRGRTGSLIRLARIVDTHLWAHPFWRSLTPWNCLIIMNSVPLFSVWLFSLSVSYH